MIRMHDLYSGWTWLIVSGLISAGVIFAQFETNGIPDRESDPEEDLYYPDAEAMNISDTFRSFEDPDTKRNIIQLTSGNFFAYPMYYFIPSFSKDLRYLIYHRYIGGEVQLWRLNIETGREVQMTYAAGTDAQWYPWQQQEGLRGVMDYLSVVNVEKDFVVYFDSTQARRVCIRTLEDELLFELEPGRRVVSQNSISPDGQWLVYIDAEDNYYETSDPAPGTKVMAWNFETEEHRHLYTDNAPFHHVVHIDNNQFILNHPVDRRGMVLGDINSANLEELRYGDPGVEHTPIHNIPTARGIAYESPQGHYINSTSKIGGLYDPFERKRFEFPLPSDFGYAHIGRDPLGRLWFFENERRGEHHDLWFLKNVNKESGLDWLQLTGNRLPYDGDYHADDHFPGQRAHYHPGLTPDRNWIMYVGGDSSSETNHIFLVDVSDLEDTRGITEDLLSHDGEHNIPDTVNHRIK